MITLLIVPLIFRESWAIAHFITINTIKISYK